MKPIADRLISFQNPLVDWEEYQVVVKPDGTTDWMLVIYDPETREPMHWEPVPPVTSNPHL